MGSEKLNSHTLLPPELVDPLFELEDFSAQKFLLISVKKMQKQIQESLPALEDTQEQEQDPDEENLDQANEEIMLNNREAVVKLAIASAEKNIQFFLFLWSIIHQDTAIKTVTAILCTKLFTMSWLDKIHDYFLPKCGLLSPQRPSLRDYRSPSVDNSVARKKSLQRQIKS